jgi:hypothetical protein
MEVMIVIAILSSLSVLLVIGLVIALYALLARFYLRRFPSKTSGVQICSPAPGLSAIQRLAWISLLDNHYSVVVIFLCLRT